MLKLLNTHAIPDFTEDFFKSYDHHKLEYTQNLYGIAHQSQRTCPVFHAESHGGFYVVTRYDDLVEIARNPSVFSSRRGFEIPEHRAPTLIPFHYDPPEATDYRRLLNPYFTLKTIDSLRDYVRSVVRRQIELHRDQGHLDAAADIARPAAASTVLKIIGLDPSQWREFTEPYHNLCFALEPPNVAYRQIYMLSQRLAAEVRAFREAPVPQTLLADLMSKQFQGRPLTDEELSSVIVTLLTAGGETTQASIGTALVYLGENPDQRALLLDKPELIPGAVEEFLRLLSAQPSMARTVMADYELGGVQLKKGDKVLLSWASANVDEAKFSAPFEPDFHRSPNPHLAFGTGIHKCLGMHLARMEIAVCLQVVLEEIPNYRIRHDKLRLAPDCSLFFGYENIPIEFA
jgi:cytochrome P450